ncbi:hypothetical protein NQ317_018954 [Molorchus minor]|uniref:beta-glucosidase n=1 Tax=Molorchus minor TaxID=1323400 RepID=A0ABQ9J6E8_9CUCU|nr:hypothetical protein NQ317_018954 [Molorchus minor]
MAAKPEHLLGNLVASVDNRKFPKGFLFGVATAAYQTEGAWNEDGKGENIWDYVIHNNPTYIRNNDTADIACDSYHKYKEDVKLAADLGIQHYRFSISWSRILPRGSADLINTKGIQFYQNLVKEILAYDMIPVGTLYHWDLPQPLQEIGGWTNPEMVRYFTDYARIVFENIDGVRYWATFNEAKMVCRHGYGSGYYAPALTLDGTADYMCSYVLLKSHAAAYHMYKKDFAHLSGKISIVLDGQWCEPATSRTEDIEAAERRLHFEFGIYANPIFLGNWPKVVIDRVKFRSERENFTKSRLPEFTQEEIDTINGTFDYLGYNNYLTNYIVPWGIRKYLQWIKKTYGDVDIFIVENGVSETGTTLEDDIRIQFYADYLNAILDAIEDGVKIVAYTAWSLIDNFEWTDGYSNRFGLYHVDFNHPNRTRTPKKSVDFYRRIATTLEIPDVSEYLKPVKSTAPTLHCYVNTLSADDINTNYFPDDFMFGVATSSYQVEGGWDADGKGENIWDHITHTNPSYIKNEDNGDIACDHYHKWKEDVQLIKDLGLNHYRNLIKELKTNNIEPVVTLHHWDYPQPLQDIGGWTNVLMADYFADYARVAFQELGEDVKFWSTFNEPKQSCQNGFSKGSLAPAIKSPGIGEYMCAYTMILAHAKAWHIYDEEFRSTQDGKISIVLNSEWAEPGSNSTDDVEAAERELQFMFGLYGNAIYNGNWPQLVIDRIGFRSKGENFTLSRLPEFTEDQIEYIKGTYDYFGFNSYRSAYIWDAEEEPFGEPSYENDVRITRKQQNNTKFVFAVALGRKKTPTLGKREFQRPPILITENGLDDDGRLEDDDRIEYYTGYLSAVLDAIFLDNVNVIGYTAWSLMDNFEWTYGYSRHYGLYYVNRSSEDLERIPKKSVDFYKKRSCHSLFVKAVNTRAFPEDFVFGVATSSYQIEGAWDADGKGENVWDHIVHTNPSYVINEDNADVTCDSYHKWEVDVELLKDLGVHSYRFSLSWARILPTGFANKINEPGITYYKNLIKALKDNGIEPVVTLHHWDFPQSLQDIGGWPNPKLADHFADYARIVFRELGDGVKYWNTFNEPRATCQGGYGDGRNAPGIKSPGVGEYLCVRTVLLAHAKAYHIYDEEFRSAQNGTQKYMPPQGPMYPEEISDLYCMDFTTNNGFVSALGMIGLALNSDWDEPASNHTADIEAAERRMQFALGLYANPIFNGGWPQAVIDRVGFRSEGEGFSQSRLPVLSDEEIEYINGTYDYFGINHYASDLVRDIDEPDFDTPSYDLDVRIQKLTDPDWNETYCGRSIVPWGQRKLLKWIKDTYNNPPIVITENGLCDDGSLEDNDRIYYHTEYLSAVLDAIYEDEVNVIGYIAWSLMDNFEWSSGYSVHFGFYHVDFSDDDRPRTAKKSVDFYKNLIATRCLSDEECTKSQWRNVVSFKVRALVTFLCYKYVYVILWCGRIFFSFVGAVNTNAFPEDFLFGLATSSYQIEGGWDADGKGENVWDHIVHTKPTYIKNNDTGDVACDAYHKWEEDVELLKDMGVKAYRFSLSWSRILPTGFANKINEPGITYYKNLIKALKDNGIEPVVTLHHWDFPQPLQDIGGWPNADLADHFADYARIVFRELGDGVKYWNTFNEPKATCQSGYGDGGCAPGIKSTGIGEYLCVRTVLLAHAKAYHIYDEEFRATQNGLVAIALNSDWDEPASNHTDDIEAAERRMQFSLGLYGNPIFNGGWPQVVIDRVAFRSEGEGFNKSRLPELSDDEIEYIKGTYDYFAINHYGSDLVRDVAESDFDTPNYNLDMRIQSLGDPDWNHTFCGWSVSTVIVPWGQRKLLKWIKDTYNNPPIMITENGLCSDDSLEDDDRISFFTGYLSAVLDAIYEDDVNVIGYTAWSFMDNFEWTNGYSLRFGFYQVDFTDDDRPRTARKSVDFYKNVIATGCLSDEECTK